MYSLSIDKQFIEHCIWYDFEKLGEIPGLKILGDFDIVDDLTLTMIVVRGVCFYPKRQIIDFFQLMFLKFIVLKKYIFL